MNCCIGLEAREREGFWDEGALVETGGIGQSTFVSKDKSLVLNSY